MRRDGKTGVDRRRFLKDIAVAGAGGAVATLPTAEAGAQTPAAAPKKPRGAAPPSAAQIAAETSKPPPAEPGLAPNCGADFMVDCLRAIGVEYVFANTAQSFVTLQESIVNYGNNVAPEFITCLHEESSVGMAHGYAKASGKIAAMACHGTVGLQHASMAIYNAWVDRAPMITILGNLIDATTRGSAPEWRHSAQDPAAIVRDFTKWDDQPTSLQHFAESIVRAQAIAATPPQAPVAISLDGELQEIDVHDLSKIKVPKVQPMIAPAGDLGAVREAARMLVAAERPVIIADRLARTAAGMSRLVELAELLNAPVIDQGGRQNFPNTHYLWQAASAGKLIGQADVILGLEVGDLWGTLNQFQMGEAGTPLTKPGAKVISITVMELLTKANYQYFERFPASDLPIVGDGEATLPALIESVKLALTADRKTAIAARAAAFRKAHADTYEAARVAVTLGWDATPISTGRFCMELYNAIKGEDWALVAAGASKLYSGNWTHRLWPIDKHYQYLGGSGGGGIGYGLPAAVGAALANKSLGRLSVNIQTDGDAMYAPGALWTAAHHRIPLLTVMHNNRAYGQEMMWMQHVANRRKRGIATAHIGTEIDNPAIDYAKLAQSMGVYAEGPITDPSKLGAALARAVQVVKRGAPALVDVVTQLR